MKTKISYFNQSYEICEGNPRGMILFLKNSTIFQENDRKKLKKPKIGFLQFLAFFIAQLLKLIWGKSDKK